MLVSFELVSLRQLVSGPGLGFTTRTCLVLVGMVITLTLQMSLRCAQPTAVGLGSHPISLTLPTSALPNQPPEHNKDTDNGHRWLCSLFIIGFAIWGAGLHWALSGPLVGA